MTDTPTPGAAAELPVVAWSLAWPLDVQRGTVNARTSFDTQTEAERYAAECMQPDRLNANPPPVVAIALTPHAPAQSQRDALREEVARLTRERDEWKEAAEHNLSRRLSALGERNAARAELAAIKAQPTDVDALMALAQDFANAHAMAFYADPELEPDSDEIAGRMKFADAAREALRAKLAARKEPT